MSGARQLSARETGAVRTRLGDRVVPYYKYFLLVPLGVLLVVCFAVPLIWLFRVSFFDSGGHSGFGIGGPAGGGFYKEGTWTLDNYVQFFSDSYFQSVTAFTIEFAALVTVLTMLLAYPFSYYIYRAKPWLKIVLLVVVILPKLSNMLVLVYGIEILLSNNGLVNKALLALGLVDQPVTLVHVLLSTVVGKILLIIPYTILVITAGLHGLDSSLRDAARGLGAGPVRTFLTVTFPLSLPTTTVALLITTIWALGAFVSPSLLGNPNLQTLAVEVPKQTFEDINWPMGSAVAFVMLALVCLVVVIFNMAINRHVPRRGQVQR
jgi:ABC-type spermidine/putrescine transport system permease subunit I